MLLLPLRWVVVDTRGDVAWHGISERAWQPPAAALLGQNWQQIGPQSNAALGDIVEDRVLSRDSPTQNRWRAVGIEPTGGRLASRRF